MGSAGDRIIKTLREMTDTTILLASHKASVLSLCDRIVVLDKGQISAIKSPAELFGLPKRKIQAVKVDKKHTKTTSITRDVN